MEICSGTSALPHEEVCFEGRKCPFCIELMEKEAINKQLSEAAEDNSKLEEEIEALQESLELCKEHCDSCPEKLKCMSTGKN